jgi:hypothetical protein
MRTSVRAIHFRTASGKNCRRAEKAPKTYSFPGKESNELPLFFQYFQSLSNSFPLSLGGIL